MALWLWVDFGGLVVFGSRCWAFAHPFSCCLQDQKSVLPGMHARCSSKSEQLPHPRTIRRGEKHRFPVEEGLCGAFGLVHGSPLPEIKASAVTLAASRHCCVGLPRKKDTPTSQGNRKEAIGTYWNPLTENLVVSLAATDNLLVVTPHIGTNQKSLVPPLPRAVL